MPWCDKKNKPFDELVGGAIEMQNCRSAIKMQRNAVKYAICKIKVHTNARFQRLDQICACECASKQKIKATNLEYWHWNMPKYIICCWLKWTVYSFDRCVPLHQSNISILFLYRFFHRLCLRRSIKICSLCCAINNTRSHVTLFNRQSNILYFQSSVKPIIYYGKCKCTVQYVLVRMHVYLIVRWWLFIDFCPVKLIV